MSPQDEKPDLIQLPSGAEALHRSIAQKAALTLGRLVDGNGLKEGQIRLAREETYICRIPASITVRLATEIITKRVKGQAAQGAVVNSSAEAVAVAGALEKGLLKEPDVLQEINVALKNDPGQGFGMEPLSLRLATQKNIFSAINTCPQCQGSASLSCMSCNGSGSMPCTTCAGSGFSSCRWCNGTGQVLGQVGSYVQCMHCQGGRTPCPTCRGSMSITCSNCRGQGRTACAECGQTGFVTEIYQVNSIARCTFDTDWRDVPPEARNAANKLGVRELATAKHAEIIWQPSIARPDDIYIPCVAFLPIARAEFTAEGQSFPVLIAGLQGRIIEIEPLLDKHVKPGISALMKLSKGPMARQALIDTACKYRLIRQVLAGLTRSSKKNVYQRLCKGYPQVLSDKYARATVKYAASAMNTLSAGPRYKGLAAGTLLTVLPATIYYLTPLRHFLLARLAQHILAVDIAVWLAGWGIAVYAIKLMTGRALKTLLPGTVSMKTGALPPAGMQGLAALLTTGLVCFAIAASAVDKPIWILYIFKPGSGG